MNDEARRLRDAHTRKANWKRWGPYLSERQWGTVREDYSAGGDPWEYFTHEQARSRAYRWGEDGLLGITDRECRLCFALALWNGHDPFLKERLFGLTGPQGNHGEDVKEYYFYIDSTPTHAYMKGLYKYPQAEFPYARLIEENRRRTRHDPEFELLDTGIFNDHRYFDIVAEYAKASPDDILIRITVANRGSEAATVHLLPTLWFRNTWSWGSTHEGSWPKPSMRQVADGIVAAEHQTLGRFRWAAAAAQGAALPTLHFTDNETNSARLFGSADASPYVKDAFHELIVGGRAEAVNPERTGTKAAAHYELLVPARGEVMVELRLFSEEAAPEQIFGKDFDRLLARRLREADEFYAARIPEELPDVQRQVARQAYAGLLWSKQFYKYIVEVWLDGDPAQPPPPEGHKHIRNEDWVHLFNRDVLSMPDKWEYPWYAAWDLSFHMIPFMALDHSFAKEQLVLMLREWYMHPNGQIPAYEWNFSDVNPPVHAWACWRIYKMSGPRGKRDRLFLSRVFQKLLVNFTWWVNRKDVQGKHLFAGGFLGLDNIGVFDRSKPLPAGESLSQADGTAWMAFYCATMMSMALELSKENAAYEDIASKFFEHFVAIADAMNRLGGTGLWSEEDGFYYDHLQVDGQSAALRVRSLVGLIPLIAVEVLEESNLEHLPGFRKRMQWFLDNRQDLAEQISYMKVDAARGHRLLAIPSQDRLLRVLRYLLDESEFLSPYGIRSLSRFHEAHPYVCHLGGMENKVAYVPGESDSGLFGGNSNWRGPIWFPLNYLLIEALERYHHFYGGDLRVECPTGSGQMRTLKEVAREISRRLVSIFLPDGKGRRPWHGEQDHYRDDPHWRELCSFHEYFHGDTGQGLGASHQTGWTALVARLLGEPARELKRKQK